LRKAGIEQCHVLRAAEFDKNTDSSPGSGDPDATFKTPNGTQVTGYSFDLEELNLKSEAAAFFLELEKQKKPLEVSVELIAKTPEDPKKRKALLDSVHSQFEKELSKYITIKGIKRNTAIPHSLTSFSPSHLKMSFIFLPENTCWESRILET